MRILSWNILKQNGATPADIATLIDRHRPGLVLLQEATAALDALPTLAGGHYTRTPMPARGHGLAAWSPTPFTATTEPLPPATLLDFPSPLFRNTTPRLALVVAAGGMLVANIHLDHGQRANRRALHHLLAQHPALDVVIGDTNALGPTPLPGFTDAGPRATTHWAYNIFPVRLDRCLLRGLAATAALALPFGPSDHRPILIDVQTGTNLASPAPFTARTPPSHDHPPQDRHHRHRRHHIRRRPRPARPL